MGNQNLAAHARVSMVPLKSGSSDCSPFSNDMNFTNPTRSAIVPSMCFFSFSALSMLFLLLWHIALQNDALARVPTELGVEVLLKVVPNELHDAVLKLFLVPFCQF